MAIILRKYIKSRVTFNNSKSTSRSEVTYTPKRLKEEHNIIELNLFWWDFHMRFTFGFPYDFYMRFHRKVKQNIRPCVRVQYNIYYVFVRVNVLYTSWFFICFKLMNNQLFIMNIILNSVICAPYSRLPVPLK